jgi:hypothetical protein
MATIFQKLPASGEQCLILEPKEGLYYPFSIGDWSELRLSMAISFTSVSDNNSFITEERTYSGLSPSSSMYIGLFSGVNGALPFQNQTSFIGFGNPTGLFVAMSKTPGGGGQPTVPGVVINSTQVGANPDNTFSPLMGGFSSVGQFFNYSSHGQGYWGTSNFTFSLSNGTLSNPPIFTVISGETNFSTIQTMRFSVVNKGSLGQSFNLGWNNNGPSSVFTDTSISNLKIRNAGISTSFTGLYYNSNLTSTGSPIDLPTNLLIYFPFVQNRARIHSILLEKY